MDAPAELESLAAKLRRPEGALRDLVCLGPDQLAELERAIDAACVRQQLDVAGALRKALPQPLRAIVLWRVRTSVR
ncbi:MAG: hypothetical protein ACT4PZ_22855 [Panacagrimonas sp.]